MPSDPPHEFSARLNVEGDGGAYVVVPPEVVAELGGGRARIPIVGSILGHAFRSSTMPMGDGRHCIGVYKAIREEAGLEAGDEVTVRVSRDASR